MLYMMALCAGMIESDQEGDPYYFLGLLSFIIRVNMGFISFQLYL